MKSPSIALVLRRLDLVAAAYSCIQALTGCGVSPCPTAEGDGARVYAYLRYSADHGLGLMILLNLGFGDLEMESVS